MRFQIANVVEEAAAAAASCVMDLQMFCGDFSVNLIDIYDG
jgi:indole-3-glycerol phosphate synthase